LDSCTELGAGKGLTGKEEIQIFEKQEKDTRRDVEKGERCAVQTLGKKDGEA